MVTNTRDLAKELEELGKRTKGLLDYAMEKALTEPIYLTEADLVDEDFDIPKGWQIKLTPSTDDELGYTQTLITPEGEEVSWEDVFDVEGEWMTRAKMEALIPEAPELVAPEVPQVIPREVFATGDEELVYRDYLRTGGTFDVETWRMIGGPLRPAETDIDTLLNEIFETGQTPETEALLRRMAPEITEEDIAGFFAPPERIVYGAPVPTLEDRIGMMRIAGTQEGEINKIIEASGVDLSTGEWQEGWWKDNILDPFIVGGSRLIYNVKQFFTSILPALAITGPPVPEEYKGLTEKEAKALYDTKMKDIYNKYPKAPYTAEKMKEPWYEEMMAAKADTYDDWQKSFTVYHMEEEQIKQLKDGFRASYSKSKVEYEDWVAKHPELLPKPEYQESPWEHPELLKDPGFWVYTISESLVYSLGILGTIAITGVATGGNVPAMVAVGTIAAGGPEANEIYEELLTYGCPEDTAGALSLLGGLTIGSIETMSDIFLLGVVSKPVRAFLLPLRKKIGLEIVKGGAKVALKKAGTSFLAVEGIEIFEEIAQGAVHNALLKSYDEDRAILENIPDTIIRTAIATLPFALLGGGAEFRNFRKSLPSELQTELDEKIKEFVDAGATEAQAQIKAVNELAKVEANEETLSKAIEANRQKPITEVPGLPTGYRVEEVEGVFSIYRPDGRKISTRTSMETAIKYAQSYESYYKLAPTVEEARAEEVVRPPIDVFEKRLTGELIKRQREITEARAKVPAVPEVKEAWQMTEAEYAELHKQRVGRYRVAERREELAEKYGTAAEKVKASIERRQAEDEMKSSLPQVARRNEVLFAIDRGEAVPVDVINSFPDAIREQLIEAQKAKPPAVAKPTIPEATKAQQAEYTKRMKPFLGKADVEIKRVNDDFMAGKTSLAENQAQRDAINAELDKQADIVRAEMGFPVAKPPVEVTEREFAEREVFEMEQELAGLKEWLATEPAAKLVGLIKKTGWRKGEISNLTIAQYKKITGKETVPVSILTADKKHVKWEYALDGIATEIGYESGEALREGIERAGESLARIKTLEAGIPVARAEVEFPVEVTPEEEIKKRLTAVQKIRRFYQEKIKSYDETKKALVDYVNKNLPLAVRGKMLAAVKNVKTELGLTRAIDRVNTLAEQNAQKVLKTEIRKEIKKARTKIKDHILKGKFTPEVQQRLDVLTHNLEMDRDVAREKMADNVRRCDDGVLSYEEMLKDNEALNFAGIDGMSAEELANTLEYIKILETIGRSERQAKQAVATERINTIRSDIINILTGEKGLKAGVGVVPRAQLAAKPGWLDTFVNWQYSLDNLADKLSKLDPTSAPYQSEINKFVAQAHRATNRQAVATRESYNKIKEAIKEVYGVKSTHDINQVLNGLNEEVNLGTFELTEAYKANNPSTTVITIKMTRDEMIAKYMQMQDPTLNNTFETGMGWSQEVRDTIENTLTENEKKLSQAIFDIYEEYYTSINEIYKELYNVDMPHNPNYSPIRRDLEGDITENVLTFQDAQQYASVINGSLKARQRNIRPLRFNGATRVLSNHIDQMEHFKAWATTMRDFRRVFGNKQIRQAIEQYHGRGISKLLDKFISQMARGGIETASTNRVADYLRRSFTKSILAIKPVIGLKQIPSLFAYLSEMSAVDFFRGVGSFWRSPIKNFQFLYKNSEGFRAIVTQGFTRDIRATTARHGVNRISGRGSFTDWFLLQIRMGDTMARTQGMWAKYQEGLKKGLSQEEAISAAEDTTNRTQPSFGIDTLSALQNGGSFLKLMTMFQNQPNKYFRIVGDNLRNFKYGRGSRTKAASTILLVWVVLPMMFQYIADAFQWKEERQLRAGLLGPLNYILIGGQLVQTAWGWVTDQPFDYQASPVLSTIDEIQKAIFKAKSMVDKGQDPYKDVTGEDIARLIEYLAKAGGQVTGLPTPFLVQVERGIRTKLKEGKDIDIKDFLFSQWALKPPAKDAGEKVEDANLKLGKTREGEEDKPLTEKELKIYTTVDWFREIGNIYSKVLPQDVLDDPNASRESKAWAEYEIARSQADVLPNISLHNINTEDNADTIIEYYQQWKARERIDNLPDLIEFDSLYPKAELGNVTRQQYSLLVKYLEAEDKDAFLENHPDLRINPRNEWLKANPVDNARLALAGQAKILSLEAFNEFKKLVKDLDIPDDAIPEFTLPPETSIDTHFAYEEFVSEGKHASWESQLLLLKDAEAAKEAGVESYAEWHDLTLSETPVRALELKIKHRELFDEYDALETDEERAKLKLDNPEWVADMRRIDAIEMDFPESLVDTYVDWYTNPDLEKPEGFEGTYYEDDWYLQEHPDFYKSMIDLGIWKERDFSKVPTREVYKLYQEWQGLPIGTARREFEAKHPDLDQWLHLKFGTKLESEREGVTTKEEEAEEEVEEEVEVDPALANRKHWLNRASYYKDMLKKLGIPEDITAEELTDAQAEEIRQAILALGRW